jgi:hypothetical protein
MNVAGLLLSKHKENATGHAKARGEWQSDQQNQPHRHRRPVQRAQIQSKIHCERALPDAAHEPPQAAVSWCGRD